MPRAVFGAAHRHRLLLQHVAWLLARWFADKDFGEAGTDSVAVVKVAVASYSLGCHTGSLT